MLTGSTVTFPVAYAEKVFSVTVGHQYYNGYIFAVQNKSLTGFESFGGPPVEARFNWFSVGQ